MILRTSLLLFVGMLPLFGQVRPVPEAPVVATGSSLPDRKIVPNDLISVVVYDEPSLSKTGRVEADGTILLPLLKSGVHVEGLLAREVETEVRQQLVDQQILVHPIVTVSILE